MYKTSAITDTDLILFTSGLKSFSIDVLVSVNTNILLQLEDSSLASGGYPSGRHSRYQVNVQGSSAWQRHRFEYLDSPDISTTSIDTMVLLFAPDSFTNNLYWFDNLETHSPTENPTLTPTVNPSQTVSTPSETCENVWHDPAGDEGYTCGERIEWLKSSENMSDNAAKNKVAEEFPDVCGPCDTSGGGGGGVPSTRNKCGIVAPDPNVDDVLSSEQCEQYGWSETGDTSMACYINGRRGEPCVLDYGNDQNPTWFDKNPADCKGDTLYLWDEPYTDREIMNPPQNDGHGAWKQAGKDWAAYSQRWSNELTLARANGLKVTSPMGKYGELMNYIDAFFEGCEIGGGSCNTEGSPGYIDVIGINVYCGSWNTGCSDAVSGGYCCDIAASWTCNDIKEKDFGKPVYITNWSALGAEALPDVQLRAIKSTPKLFECGSHVIDRVYWYGAVMYDETPRFSNFLYQNAGSGTLGSEWKEICDQINAS